MEVQKILKSQIQVRKTNDAVGTMIADVKLYYKAVVTKAIWHWTEANV
jgi:hypothetical protein